MSIQSDEYLKAFRYYLAGAEVLTPSYELGILNKIGKETSPFPLGVDLEKWKDEEFATTYRLPSYYQEEIQKRVAFLSSMWNECDIQPQFGTHYTPMKISVPRGENENLLEDKYLEGVSEAIAVSIDQQIPRWLVQRGLIRLVRLLNPEKKLDYLALRNVLIESVLSSIDRREDFRETLANGKWMLNSDTGLQIAIFKDDKGNYLIDSQNAGLKEIGIPDHLMLFPIIFNEWMDNVGKKQPAVMFGNWKNVQLYIHPQISVYHTEFPDFDKPGKVDRAWITHCAIGFSLVPEQSITGLIV